MIKLQCSYFRPYDRLGFGKTFMLRFKRSNVSSSRMTCSTFDTLKWAFGLRLCLKLLLIIWIILLYLICGKRNFGIFLIRLKCKCGSHYSELYTIHTLRVGLISSIKELLSHKLSCLSCFVSLRSLSIQEYKLWQLGWTTNLTDSRRKEKYKFFV